MPEPGTRYDFISGPGVMFGRSPEDIALSRTVIFRIPLAAMSWFSDYCVWLSCWFAIRYAFAAAYVAWLSTEVSMHVHANFLVYVLKFVFSCSTSIEREEHEK